MTDAEIKRYATLICDAIQDGTPFARANTALARERAKRDIRQHADDHQRIVARQQKAK